MPVGEPEPGEGPVNLRAAERARHGRRALACKRSRESEALQGRGGVAYTTLSTFAERNAVDAGTTPGMDDSRDGGGRTASGTAVEDDCRDAGRLQGCRTTAGMQELEQRRSGCRARATQERLPSQSNAGSSCRGRVASGTATEIRGRSR